MKNFLSRITTKKVWFALLLTFVSYFTLMWNVYSIEAEKIGHLSTRRFGGDISTQLGFFEVLKSADYSYSFYIINSLVFGFIPWLLIAIYWFDYKKESHLGWSRILLSTQILILILLLIFIGGRELGWYFSFIDRVGLYGVMALVLVRIFNWIRNGFAKQTN